MKIIMNKDISANRYGRKISRGDIITISSCCIVFLSFYVIFHKVFGISLEVSMYFCIPLVAGIGYLGFDKKDGMNRLFIIQRKIALAVHGRILYSSTEQEVYQEAYHEFEEIEEKKKGRRKQK